MASIEPEISRYRSLSGGWRCLTRVLLSVLPVMGVFFILDIPFYLKWAIMREQYYGLFLGMVLACIFLLVPPTRRGAREGVPWYDVILSVLGFGVGLYVALFYPGILEKLGVITADRVILGTIAILLILEGLRRLMGWVLVGLGLLFILYARFTWLVPGIFSGPGISWERLSNYLFLDPNALLGTPMMVTAVIVLAFILLGNLLFGVGGGTFLTNMAMSVFGRFRGGPAKMAVVASSLFGTISGSAVANVATTGVITIPLMKQTGYKAHLAGAIEAVASTGGQLMPPIMGAAAFLIAEFTQIPYREVAVAALFPALLYYIVLFVQVDLEAGKGGLRGLPRDALPRLRGVLGKSYLFFVPLLVLIYALFILLLTPEKAALFSVGSILVVSFFESQTRLRLTWFLEALEKTGRALLELTVIVALAGLVIGVIHSTGVGFLLTMSLVDLAGGKVYVLLLMIAGAGIILGMGMPTTGVYILLAVLLAPALVELGVDLLAAHLFVLYWGMVSMITPPICLAAYAGAAIAGSGAMRTGYASTRLGIVALVIPFLFVFSPALMLKGSLGEITLATTTAVFGCLMLGCALTGYLFLNLNLIKRVLMALAGISLLIPTSGQLFMLGLFTDVLGGSLALVLFLWEWRRKLQLVVTSKKGSEKSIV